MQTAWETAALPGAPAGACRVGACSSGKCQRKPYFFQIILTLSLYFLLRFLMALFTERVLFRDFFTAFCLWSESKLATVWALQNKQSDESVHQGRAWQRRGGRRPWTGQEPAPPGSRGTFCTSVLRSHHGGRGRGQISGPPPCFDMISLQILT